MDERLHELCDAIGRGMVAGDYGAVHARLAPWVREQVSPEDIAGMVEEEMSWLEHPPDSWTENEGMSGPEILAELRSTDTFGPPKNGLPAEVTDENFRSWVSLQFVPRPEVHEEQNVCFDVWFVAVDHEGQLLAGSFDTDEAT